MNGGIERVSFGLGLLTGILLMLVWPWVRGGLQAGREKLRQRRGSAAQRRAQGAEEAARRATLQAAQARHLAGDLFPLEAVLIPGRLLAPPLPDEEAAFPYLPDWPELGAAYAAPALTLAQALSGGAPVVVIGPPGCGKTTLLSELAIAWSQGTLAGDLGQALLVWAEAGDLLDGEDGPDPLRPFLGSGAAPNPNAAFDQGRGLLLLDGLDELSPAGVERVTERLAALLERYPQTRIAAAGHSGALDGLRRLGFVPLSLLPWTEAQRAAFVRQWGRAWKETQGAPALDPVLLEGWLNNLPASLPGMRTALDWTLRVWAAYAGQPCGPERRAAWDGFLRRAGLDGPQVQALAHWMAGLLTHLQTAATLEAGSAWADLPSVGLAQLGQAQLGQAQLGQGQAAAAVDPAAWIEAGVLVRLANGRVRPCHLSLAGCLAAQALDEAAAISLQMQPEWALKSETLLFLTRPTDEPPAPDADPLQEALLEAARRLRDLPDEAPLRSAVSRRLAALLQQADLADGMRARVVTALATSGSPGVAVLLRTSLTGPLTPLRWLAALGSGLLRDPRAVDELNGLLEDSSPGVRRAACLALGRIGTRAALDALGAALVQGDEALRRMAAQALTLNVEEGHPALMEAAAMPDLLVRRASVAGLERLPHDWARATLEKLAQDDPQWAVQSAAAEALEAARRPDAHIPHPAPALTETPWLIAFAAERGLGVAPGKPAMELVLQAVQYGKEEQREAALQELGRRGEASALTLIAAVLARPAPAAVREAAVLALWRLRAFGVGEEGL